MTGLILSSMILSGALAAAAAPPAVDVRASYEGIAESLKRGSVVYIERHKEERENGRRVGLFTRYEREDGTVIAERTVDFRRSLFVPDFRLVDQRDGYTEGAELTDDGVRLFLRKSADEPLSDVTVRIPEPAVVDAGFNNFVQERWASIEAGEKQYFNFGVPFAGDYYGFRVYKEEMRDENGRRLMIVHLDIDNFIIRLFLDPIVLSYDVASRRLVQYEGISNINDERGKSHIVRILYDPYGP